MNPFSSAALTALYALRSSLVFARRLFIFVPSEQGWFQAEAYHTNGSSVAELTRWPRLN